MPRIIRRALLEKLISLHEWREFREDFQTATGLDLELLDDFGSPALDPFAPRGMCALLHSSGSGRRHCAKFTQNLLAGAGEYAAAAVCDAGLEEVAIPVRVSGLTVGFLLVRGLAVGEFPEQRISRVRHLLARQGLRLRAGEIASALGLSHCVERRLLTAYQRWLGMAARELAAHLTDHFNRPPESMPPAVERACRLIRARALRDDLVLGEVARACGVSPGHLCRLFHHATGLTFSEYVSRFRAGHARTLLAQTSKTVSEIAFESGFQSISQFHRVFRRIYGKAPGKFRPPRKLAPGSPVQTDTNEFTPTGNMS